MKVELSKDEVKKVQELLNEQYKWNPDISSSDHYWLLWLMDQRVLRMQNFRYYWRY